MSSLRKAFGLERRSARGTGFLESRDVVLPRSICLGKEMTVVDCGGGGDPGVRSLGLSY